RRPTRIALQPEEAIAKKRKMCTIAVGTLIAERPPHRTGRAQLRHPAPTLDVGGEAYALPHAFQAVGGALPARCPGRAVLFRVLLGLRPWLHELLGRSPGLVRSLHSDSWRSLTPRPRASSASARRLPDADRSPPGLTRGSRSPGFRARSLRTCQGLRPRRTGNALALTRAPVSPSAHDIGCVVPIDSFAAQWLAYTHPCRRLPARPRGRRRTARGRCGSLFLHRSGLAPPTPRRPPGALSCLDGAPCQGFR